MLNQILEIVTWWRTTKASAVNAPAIAPKALDKVVNRDGQSRTDLAHAIASKTAQPIGQCPNRNTLDRIQVDRRPKRDRIITRVKDHLTGQSPDCRCARSDQSSPKSRDGHVP